VIEAIRRGRTDEADFHGLSLVGPLRNGVDAPQADYSRH